MIFSKFVCDHHHYPIDRTIVSIRNNEKKNNVCGCEGIVSKQIRKFRIKTLIDFSPPHKKKSGGKKYSKNSSEIPWKKKRFFSSTIIEFSNQNFNFLQINL